MKFSFFVNLKQGDVVRHNGKVQVRNTVIENMAIQDSYWNYLINCKLNENYVSPEEMEALRHRDNRKES